MSTLKAARKTARRATNRIQPLLDSAARQFARRGFHATTTRDITTPVGMTPGSIYSHFASKDDLLLAVYAQGVQRVLRGIDTALAESQGPWAQLEAVAVAHLEAILDQSDYARVMIRVLPEDVPSVANELRELRDRVESRYRALIGKLQLPAQADRKFFRLLLLGALNWSPVWYRPQKDQVRRIAKTFIGLLREGHGEGES